MTCPNCKAEIEKVYASGEAAVEVRAEVTTELTRDDLAGKNVYHSDLLGKRFLLDFRLEDTNIYPNSEILDHTNFHLDGEDTMFFCGECNELLTLSMVEAWAAEQPVTP